ncbi:MAG: alginate lyase, partial [Paenibacillus sp.]|nr:alginate lyase [Paenibacillus sp.]
MSKPLYQPQSGVLTVQYAPDEQTVLIENPPRFTWIPAQLEHDRYVLQYSRSPQFDSNATVTVQSIPYNLYTPDHALEPGVYYWRYALLLEQEEGAEDRSAAQTEWSQTRSFTVAAGLPETPLAARETRYAQAAKEHPRLWLQAEELPAFRRKVRENPASVGWDAFYERSVKPWIDRELIAEPLPYPNNKRVANLWRQMYIDCQEVLYAVRHLSVAGVVLEDRSLIERAKAWLLHATSWDPNGTSSRDYNDEASFRITGALAWGYDWLYNELSHEERELVRANLLQRTEQIAFHVMERSKIHHVPFDSHAVRSLSSVLVPGCIAMLGEEGKAEDWLNYTLEYYACLYSPWGGVDGGWAEGPMYWTTGMAFVTEAINLLKKYTGINFYQRPFFQKTGDYPLYCFSPDTLRASFGDQSTLGDPVSLKTGFNIRQFAGITNNGLYQWYFEQTKAIDTD